MHDSNSTNFERRLREAVEERTPLDAPELRTEAAASAENSEAYRREAIVETAVASARETTNDIDLADAVLAALESTPAETAPAPVPALTTRPTAPAGGRSPVLALTVAAAALLVAVLVLRGPDADRPDTTRRNPSVADNDTTGRTTDVRPGPEPPRVPGERNELVRLFAEASSAYEGLATETRVAVADFGFLVPAANGLTTPPVVAPPEPPEMMDTTPSWFDRVDGQLAPVRDNVGRTLEFLLEPVPEDSSMAT